MMADENANERFDLGKETHRMREAEMARCIEIFNTAPELRASFLVKLQNGATVNGVHGICSRCKRRIDPADVHGRVSWPIAAVAVVEASGICRPCSTMTQLYLRLRPTGDSYRAETPSLDGRGWRFAQPVPISWWRATLRRLARKGR